MNFFEHQARARRRTFGLVGLFALALICIVVLVDLVVLASFGSYHELADPGRYMDYLDQGIPGLFDRYVRPNLQMLLWVSLATGGGIALASQIRVLSLRGGGGTVARGLGGTLVPPDTTDPLRRRLRNVVEEMAIASGVPVPEVYVLDHEPGINAFAAGYTPADAAIAVTQGTLETLNRAELQGVVAHEFGHILNGDMRLNIRLMGVLFGILMLALLGRFLLNSGSYAARREGRGVVSIGLALVAVGYVGLFFGRLIKASVSRQREFLADASAVQFTRHPEGIAGALKKIGAAGAGSVLQADAEEVAHMLFAQGFSSRLLATHPLLEDRIRAIEPGFDPAEFVEIARTLRRQSPASVPGESVESPSDDARIAPLAARAAAVDPDALVRGIGRPGAGQILAAGLIAAAIPRMLERAAHSAEWAAGVLCYLLMGSDPEVRERRLLMVAETLGQESERQVDMLLREVPDLAPELRIPLLDMAFPVLRRRPVAELERLLGLVDRLILADGRVEVFEYVLAKLLARQIRDLLSPASASVAGSGRLAGATPEVVLLLGVLARHGHEGGEGARVALDAGLKRLGAKLQAPEGIKGIWFESDWLDQEWSVRLDAALARLDRLRLEDKRCLLEAMAAVVLADGRLVPAEMELLRAMCAALRMPLPVLEPEQNRS
ncbi:M48 family metallopeptidase [Imhoffiella purpurea]|uniref:Heat shock protein HtpX n=1 Tax=Imhoffiella purpurea TaxID=1249627 RepID=W9VGX9_9GAMM|nr:M48 family metallopeptidase [Imhoffiella purpurea]EXJ15302.1 Heat shock protein HtpX [Imhoffiella purpurea]